MTAHLPTSLVGRRLTRRGALRGGGLAAFGLFGAGKRLLARYGAGVGAPLPKLARGVPLR